MAANAYTLYAVYINGTLISQITSQSIDLAVQSAIEGGHGTHLPAFSGHMQQMPIASFTTTMVETALVLTSQALAIGTDVRLYFQKMDHGGTRASGSVHQLCTINDGIVILRNVNASQGQPATARYDIIATYDGTNLPFAMTTAALAGTPATSELFTVGPAEIAGVAYDTQSIDWDTGIQEYTQHSSGGPYPLIAAVMEIRPKITVSTNDIIAATTISGDGASVGDGDCIFWLRCMQSGAIPYANASLQHIKLQVTEGIVHFGATQADHNGPASSDIITEAVYDGSNDIVQITANQAIA